MTAFVVHCADAPMGDWQNEDDIKAELRVLTGELKQLREELRNMVTPKKNSPSRAFLHRTSWPSGAHSEPADLAHDKPKTDRRKKPR